MNSLHQASYDNVELIIETITNKLKMASAAAMQAQHFDLEHYEDLLDIYEVIQSKSSFSISEVNAIVSELGKLRKK